MPLCAITSANENACCTFRSRQILHKCVSEARGRHIQSASSRELLAPDRAHGLPDIASLGRFARRGRERSFPADRNGPLCCMHQHGTITAVKHSSSSSPAHTFAPTSLPSLLLLLAAAVIVPVLLVVPKHALGRRALSLHQQQQRQGGYFSLSREQGLFADLSVRGMPLRRGD